MKWPKLALREYRSYLLWYTFWREQRAEKFTRPSNITKRLVSYKKLFGSIYLEGKMLML
jgi:hypothetical protein